MEAGAGYFSDLEENGRDLPRSVALRLYSRLCLGGRFRRNGFDLGRRLLGQRPALARRRSDAQAFLVMFPTQDQWIRFRLWRLNGASALVAGGAALWLFILAARLESWTMVFVGLVVEAFATFNLIVFLVNHFEAPRISPASRPDKVDLGRD